MNFEPLNVAVMTEIRGIQRLVKSFPCGQYDIIFSEPIIAFHAEGQ